MIGNYQEEDLENDCIDDEKEIKKNEEEIDEEMVSIEFESISESFMKKYQRYSDKLQDNNNKYNLKEDERKFHSSEENKCTGKITKRYSALSPFVAAKTKSLDDSRKFIPDDFKIEMSESLSLSNQKTLEATDYLINNHKLNIVDLTNEINLNGNKTISSNKNSLRGSRTSSNSESKFTLPRRKKVKRIFEEFLVIGIEKEGLEYINDLDEMLLTPRIIYNYPNHLGENEMKFNIKFLKNFCFNEGVKVYRNEISSNDEFEMTILERNFFSKPKSHFCLVQQISPEDIQKYFIFGIKFEDFYVTQLKVRKDDTDTGEKIDKRNYVNIFTYEKTYLFISYEPLCKFFEEIFQTILNVKKLNYLLNMSEFSSIFVKNKYNQFIEENNEKLGVQIHEILNFYYNKKFPLFEEVISFKSEFNNVISSYRYPNPFNENFLAIDWLSKKMFDILDYSTLFNVLLRILVEHSIIFICDNIQQLTSFVLGFSYLIQPFKWPFIIIPNLPIELMNMIDSPVPYLIGILGDENLKKEMLKNAASHNYDIVYIYNNRVEFIVILFFNLNLAHPACQIH